MLEAESKARLAMFSVLSGEPSVDSNDRFIGSRSWITAPSSPASSLVRCSISDLANAD